MGKQITITSEATHGARISCTCGWADKSYGDKAKSVANYHNQNKHGNKYRVFNIQKESK